MSSATPIELSNDKHRVKLYAVVRFLSEEEETIATAPKSWVCVEGEGLACKWPPKNLNVQSLIKKLVPPMPLWENWRCQILKEFDTDSEVSSQEETSWDNTIQALQHKSSSDPQCERMCSSHDGDEQLNYEDPLGDELDNTITGNSDVIILDVPDMSTNTVLPGCEACATILPTLLNHIAVQEIQLAAINAKLDRLLNAEGNINLNLEEENANILLPLNSTEEIEELERKLDTQKYRNHLKKILLLVGGTDSHKLIRRCLARIFADGLATKCSFTGAKSNFKIKGLKIVEELQKVVQHHFPATSDFEFEKVVQDFFRYAAQRLARLHQ